MLKIHFLNVGHGDCCIVEFIDESRTAVIDINRTSEMDEQSLTELAESFSISLDSLYGQSVTAALERAGYDIELQDPITYLNDMNKSSIFRFISTHPHMDHLSGLNTLNDSFLISNVWVIKNNFLVGSCGEIKSRLEQVAFDIEIEGTRSKGYCYCLKVDANGELRLKDLIEFIDTKLVDYAVLKKN